MSTAERVDSARIGERLAAVQRQRFAEQLDRLVEAFGTECDLPEPGNGGRAARVSRLQARAIEALGLVDVTDAQRDLGFEQIRRLGERRVDAGREPLRRDAEPDGELVDHLQRRHARARFET